MKDRVIPISSFVLPSVVISTSTICRRRGGEVKHIHVCVKNPEGLTYLVAIVADIKFLVCHDDILFTVRAVLHLTHNTWGGGGKVVAVSMVRACLTHPTLLGHLWITAGQEKMWR